MTTVIERPLNLRDCRDRFLWERRVERHNRRVMRKHRKEEWLRHMLIGGGAAGSWTFTNGGRTKLLDGTFDIDSDTWKIALFLSTSNLNQATSTTYAALTNEHANANGYTTGGVSITLTLSGTTTVTCAASANASWTASGGSIIAKWAVIYEVGGNILCSCSLDSGGADVTTTTGNTLTITLTSIFTLA